MTRKWLKRGLIMTLLACVMLIGAMQTAAAAFSSPTYFPAPDIDYGEWKKDGSNLQIRVRVNNVDTRRTIRAFEVYMYARDVWGDLIYGENIVYYGTTKKTIKPGERAYSAYLTLPNRKDIDRVYAAVKRIVTTDNETIEFKDLNFDKDFSCFVITYK